MRACGRRRDGAGAVGSSRPPGATRARPSDRVPRVRSSTRSAASVPSTARPSLDLFAGSGALGIEALSRGAAPLHLRRAGAGRRRCHPRPTSTTAGRRRPRHVVEPARSRPTSAAEPAAGRPRAVRPALRLRRLGRRSWRARRCRPASSCASRTGPSTSAPGWDAARTRRYGGTVVTFGRPAGAHENVSRLVQGPVPGELRSRSTTVTSRSSRSASRLFGDVIVAAMVNRDRRTGLFPLGRARRHDRGVGRPPGQRPGRAPARASWSTPPTRSAPTSS